MTAPSVVIWQVSLPGLLVVMVATAMYGCGASNAISIVPASPLPSDEMRSEALTAGEPVLSLSASI